MPLPTTSSAGSPPDSPGSDRPHHCCVGGRRRGPRPGSLWRAPSVGGRLVVLVQLRRVRVAQRTQGTGGRGRGGEAVAVEQSQVACLSGDSRAMSSSRSSWPSVVPGRRRHAVRWELRQLQPASRYALISSARSSARANAVRVIRVGGRCNRSSSENREPSRVFSVATKSPGNAGSARRAAPRPWRAAASPQPSAPPTPPGKHRYPRQQHPVTAQPAHRLVEQRHRSLGVRPRPPVQERTEPPRPLRVLVLVVRVGIPDLPRVLVRRRLALGVPLHARDA